MIVEGFEFELEIGEVLAEEVVRRFEERLRETMLLGIRVVELPSLPEGTMVLAGREDSVKIINIGVGDGVPVLRDECARG